MDLFLCDFLNVWMALWFTMSDHISMGRTLYLIFNLHFFQVFCQRVKINKHHLTCFPSSVYSLFTAPESSLMASVMSASTCSKEWAVFLFSRILTALRGFTPLRITVTSLGLIKSLFSLPSRTSVRSLETVTVLANTPADAVAGRLELAEPVTELAPGFQLGTEILA